MRGEVLAFGGGRVGGGEGAVVGAFGGEDGLGEEVLEGVGLGGWWAGVGQEGY